MVSGATKFMERYINHPYLELFFSPRGGNTTHLLEMSNWVFGVDNGAFSDFDEVKFLTKLARLDAYKERCLFVTLASFHHWASIINDWPLAFVAQDGQLPGDVPWDAVTTLFIGGTNAFKLNPDAVLPLVAAAKARNLWVHMGRVNSNKRLSLAFAWGCDSVDGSGYSRFPDTLIPPALAHLEKLHTGLARD